MVDGYVFIFAIVICFVTGGLLGWAADSDREFLRVRLEWADKVCEPHGGARLVDTSGAFSSREVECKDGTKIYASGNEAPNGEVK